MFNLIQTNRFQLTFDLVFACDDKGGIGKGNAMPWHLKSETRHFRELTSCSSDPALQNVVIMGRRTWESLPEKHQPLPNRLNIVLTRNPNYRLPKAVLRFSNLDKALESLTSLRVDRVFVIGGAEVFKQAMVHKNCGLLYLTEIMQTFDCDTFLPDFKRAFSMQSCSKKQNEDGVDYYYKVYVPNSYQFDEHKS